MSIYDSNCDYNKYKVFYAVAEYNSFSKASEVLHISQPAISYSVKELENQLNSKLFIRENRTIKLTDDGERLMFFLRRAFNDISIAEKIIKEKQEEFSGTVRIGIYSHISLVLLPDLFKEFTSSNPNVKFEVITSSSNELKEKIKNRELDFVIAQYPLLVENSSIFTEENLFELKNCFFAQKETYELYNKNQLNGLSLILPFRGFPDIDSLDELIRISKINIKNNYRIYNFELTKKLVLNNFGIGWGPEICIKKELENKELYKISLKFDVPNTKFSITYNQKALNDTSIKFLNFIKSKLKNIN